MIAANEFISVQATEQIVDALNSALELEGEQPDARVELFLRRLQQLLDRQSRCALWLLEDLSRQPSPRITRRVVVRPPFDTGAMASIEDAQRALQDAAPLSDPMVEAVLDHIRTPVTRIMSASKAEQNWFQTMVKRYLAPIGCADCIASLWAASPDRAIFLICHRRETDRPFCDRDITLTSLMLRAVAPIVDRDLFQRDETLGPLNELSQREREILLMLLTGESEKQIAAALFRSVHTVHTFVQKIYRQFKVSSRGELMALFVDRAVVASIKHELPS